MARTKAKAKQLVKEQTGKADSNAPATATTINKGGGRKRKRMWRSAYVREIRACQKQTTNLVPRSPMQRLIRELTGTMTDGGKRWTKDALERVHVEAEAFITDVLSRANNYTVNANRCTVRPRDIKAANADIKAEQNRLRAAAAQ